MAVPRVAPLLFAVACFLAAPCMIPTRTRMPGAGTSAPSGGAAHTHAHTHTHTWSWSWSWSPCCATAEMDDSFFDEEDDIHLDVDLEALATGVPLAHVSGSKDTGTGTGTAAADVQDAADNTGAGDVGVGVDVDVDVGGFGGLDEEDFGGHGGGSSSGDEKLEKLVGRSTAPLYTKPTKSTVVPNPNPEPAQRKQAAKPKQPQQPQQPQRAKPRESTNARAPSGQKPETRERAPTRQPARAQVPAARAPPARARPAAAPNPPRSAPATDQPSHPPRPTPERAAGGATGGEPAGDFADAGFGRGAAGEGSGDSSGDHRGSLLDPAAVLGQAILLMLGYWSLRSSARAATTSAADRQCLQLALRFRELEEAGEAASTTDWEQYIQDVGVVLGTLTEAVGSAFDTLTQAQEQQWKAKLEACRSSARLEMDDLSDCPKELREQKGAIDAAAERQAELIASIAAADGAGDEDIIAVATAHGLTHLPEVQALEERVQQKEELKLVRTSPYPPPPLLVCCAAL